MLLFIPFHAIQALALFLQAQDSFCNIFVFIPLPLLFLGLCCPAGDEFGNRMHASRLMKKQYKG